MADEQTFLKLLVAQLRKTEPESRPTETRIAQVTIHSRQDLDSIKGALSAAQAATTLSALSDLESEPGEIGQPHTSASS